MKIETFFMIASVAIQGVKGSFHHIVSQQYFDKDILIEECLTFDNVVDSILNGTHDAAIMAIENSIAGSIIPNYALIDNYDLHIVGEHYLDIQHHLMALPDQSIKEIKESNILKWISSKYLINDFEFLI